MSTKTQTTKPKQNKSPRAFRRTEQPTDKELTEDFQLYVKVAVRAYREEQKGLEDFSTKEPAWGAKYGNQTISLWECMKTALENISAPKGKNLDWVCKNCGDTGCDCNKEDDNDEDDD